MIEMKCLVTDVNAFAGGNLSNLLNEKTALISGFAEEM